MAANARQTKVEESIPAPAPSVGRTVPERKFRSLQPKRSLTTILIICFLLISLVPLMFVTGYSLVKYEQAIDNELVQRLRGNAREFVTNMDEYEKYLETRATRVHSDQAFSYFVLTDSMTQVRQFMQNSIRGSALNLTMVAFNRDGQMIASYIKDDGGNARLNSELENANFALRESYREEIRKNGRMMLVDSGPHNSMELINYTRLDAKNGRLAGYVEEITRVGSAFLDKLKNRLDVEVVLFDPRGSIVASTHPDFLVYPKESFAKTIMNASGVATETFFDLTLRGDPYGFITVPVKWGESQFVVGLGASKLRARAFVRNVSSAFFTMIAAIGILLIVTSVIATRIIVRPVAEMVDAIQAMDARDAPVSIPLTTDTELGVLTESFNEMSRRMYGAKGELEKKVKELEGAYAEVKEAQSRLVHAAKMASLGQLVAGIAHELNNPIGFIYSNMSHLRDYSQRLLAIIEAAEKKKGSIKDAKAENDFEYIVQDLPRLISSCEDGARRTRDIVLGLRSFSRLEQAKVKRVNLQEGIEDTLRLLNGEMKNRIVVHQDFHKIPEVLCYPSELNQVFMNILSNAAQAIEGEGEIWITLRAVAKKKAQIVIKDSGKGIAPEIVDKIFDPFYTTKSVGEGTGLGLSISYGIIKKHGGEIQVASTPGNGTEFVITIPIDGVPATAS